MQARVSSAIKVTSGGEKPHAVMPAQTTQVSSVLPRSRAILVQAKTVEQGVHPRNLPGQCHTHPWPPILTKVKAPSPHSRVLPRKKNLTTTATSHTCPGRAWLTKPVGNVPGAWCCHDCHNIAMGHLPGSRTGHTSSCDCRMGPCLWAMSYHLASQNLEHPVLVHQTVFALLMSGACAVRDIMKLLGR